MLHTVSRENGEWIGHSWRGNRLLEHVIEGKIEVKEILGRRRKQLLNEQRET